MENPAHGTEIMTRDQQERARDLIVRLFTGIRDESIEIRASAQLLLDTAQLACEFLDEATQETQEDKEGVSKDIFNRAKF